MLYVRIYASVLQLVPPHFPCSPLVNGGNLAFSPGVGWAGAVPDAKATVNLKVNGTDVSFEGTGYHDLVSLILRTVESLV